MTTFSSLVSRLQSAVAARNGVPSEAQYSQAVKDAVSDYSRRNPLRRVGTLSIVPGQAAYDLPADFCKMIRLLSLTSPQGIINTPSGLIPVDANWSEKWTVTGRKITFYPTPTYSLARDFEYAATYLLGSSAGQEAYTDMTEEVEALVLMKAQAITMMLQASAAAREAWSYQIGDERVSKEKLSSELRAQANEIEAQYIVAVSMQIGPLGGRA